MIPKYWKKLKKYIRHNDVSKFKRFVRKYEIDVMRETVNNGNTMLHIACQDGSDLIMRFLLRKGSDVTLQNKHGQLPLHLACLYASSADGQCFAETDLVLPLIKVSPSSLDVEDLKGMTPRMLLESTKRRLQQQDQQTDEEEENAEDESDCSSESEESDLWNKKMADEIIFETATYFNDYGDDDGYEPETLDDWAFKISKEYETKHQNSFRPTSTSKKRQQKNRSKFKSDDVPKIPDEKVKNFEKKMAEHRKELMQGIDARKRTKMAERKTIYEKKCVKFFAGEDSSQVGLGYDVIPWPHEPGEGLETVEKFLFGDLEKGSMEYRSYLRKQQVRWHPDRFLHRCGGRLVAGQRRRILEKVKALSQLLNGLSQMMTS